ncbi:hypothetical protein PM082_023395 [Marasmius tenuissimus]|nr:hypothetical protein PM082_023395 [Marasmius tenuissimus]
MANEKNPNINEQDHEPNEEVDITDSENTGDNKPEHEETTGCSSSEESSPSIYGQGESDDKYGHNVNAADIESGEDSNWAGSDDVAKFVE